MKLYLPIILQFAAAGSLIILAAMVLSNIVMR